MSLAWLVLWTWGQSPYGRYLDHDQLSTVLGEDAILLVVFVAGWTLMVFAMMLPTSLPLIALFHTMTRGRSDHMLLMTLLIAGYVGTWMVFGAIVHAGDLGLHEAVEQSAWLEANSWAIGAGTLMLAGVYQFTPLKYQCLDKCRSPLSFVMEHWRGSHERTQSLWLGVHHGIFCIGCCWSLMLLMFAVGAGSIGWMLVLGDGDGHREEHAMGPPAREAVGADPYRRLDSDNVSGLGFLAPVATLATFARLQSRRWRGHRYLTFRLGFSQGTHHSQGVGR